MPIRGLIAALVIAPVAMLPVLATSAQAQQSQEQTALNVQPTSAAEARAIAFRKLQSELMVATLSCNDKRITAQYNAFVTHYRADLRQNAKILKALFKRKHGAKAQHMLDSFMTGLANQASRESMDDADFCAKALSRFEALGYDNDAGQTAEMQ